MKDKFLTFRVQFSSFILMFFYLFVCSFVCFKFLYCVHLLWLWVYSSYWMVYLRVQNVLRSWSNGHIRLNPSAPSLNLFCLSFRLWLLLFQLLLNHESSNCVFNVQYLQTHHHHKWEFFIKDILVGSPYSKHNIFTDCCWKRTDCLNIVVNLSCNPLTTESSRVK